jgi:hypothetical protein
MSDDIEVAASVSVMSLAEMSLASAYVFDPYMRRNNCAYRYLLSLNNEPQP